MLFIFSTFLMDAILMTYQKNFGFASSSLAEQLGEKLSDDLTGGGTEL